MFKSLVINLIKLYKVLISPQLVFLTGVHGCKFRPTCSEYTVKQIEEDGVLVGLKKGFLRLLSCR